MSQHGRGDIRMKVFRMAMVVFAGLLLASGACRAWDPAGG
jgi:hypothetical protein